MMKRMVQATPVENRINLTPVIDVALVLVIILLVTAPMLAVAELGLTLPEARTVRFDDENRINISLGKDGRVAIGERIVHRDVFVRELSSELSERAEDSPLVVVRADTAMSHGMADHEGGFATADAMIAMLVLALTIGLALNAASTARRLALRATEVRQANLLAGQLLSRLQDADQVETGKLGGLDWRLETTVVAAAADPDAPPLSRRTVAITAPSGRVYRDGLSVLCGDDHAAP